MQKRDHGVVWGEDRGGRYVEKRESERERRGGGTSEVIYEK